MISCKISNIGVNIMSIQRPDRIDEHTTCTVVVRDDNGLAVYQKGNPITIDDSILGNIFTGYVTQPSMQDEYPSAMNIWTLTCVQEGDYHASKRTTDWLYDKQFGGTIAVHQIQQWGSQEGLLARAALRWDETQTSWSEGTLTNTVATTNTSNGNTGGGDLELALAGSQINISIDTDAEFNAGSYIGTSLVGGRLAPTPTPAIKFVAKCTLNDAGNLYSYMKVWGGSQAVTSNNFLNYDMWLDPANPEAKVAVDIIFSDGTTLRDTSVYSDAQSMPPHPNTDLSNFAGVWYHRSIFLGPYNGKTIVSVVTAAEGDKVGTYTGYFKNIYLDTGSGNVYFFQAALNTAQQQQVNGYAATDVSVVSTYDLPLYNPQGEGSGPWSSACYWSSAYLSIDTAKIYKDGLLSYQATVPSGTLFQMKYSLDYPSSSAGAILCTNNALLPSIPPGLKIAGRSIALVAQFYRDGSANPLASPEVCPSLSNISLTINPTYSMTKTDVEAAYVQSSDWTTGATLTNTQPSFLASKVLGLVQYVRNWDDGSVASQTLYNTGSGAGQVVNNRRFQVSCATGQIAHSRMDFAGTLADFTTECQLQVSSVCNTRFTYRTTAWANVDNFAYGIEINTTNIKLYKGTNTTSAGSYTQIGSTYTFSSALSGGSFHAVRLVVLGNSHKVYVDDFLVITATDGTFTSAGNFGLGLSNPSGSTQAVLFDNFGVTSSLSGTWVSPSISLSSATTYGTSIVAWRSQNQDATNCVDPLVETSINGGSSWQTATNGGAISGLTLGQSLAGISLKIRVTLQTTTASTMSGLDNLIVRVLQQFNATGTRVAPALSLLPVGRAGTALVNFNAVQLTHTSALVQTSIDNGSTWQTPGNSTIILADSPQAYYRLSEASGTVAIDSSGNGYNATLSGVSAYSQTGAIANDSDTAISFLAGGGLSLPFTLDVGSWAQVTIEYWINLNDSTGWHHVVLQESLSSGQLFYLDGSLVALDSTGSIYTDYYFESSGSVAVAGLLDEIAIYSYLLSQSRIQTHYQAGASYLQIPGITIQPDPYEDVFTSDTSANYTNTSITGGTIAPITPDTSNSRITLTSGSTGIYRYDGQSFADGSAMADLDQADNSGLCGRIASSYALRVFGGSVPILSTMYALYISDSSASSNANTFKLDAIVSGVHTTLATGPISFTRGHIRRFILDCQGTTIKASMDSNTLASVTDSSIGGSGKFGLLVNSLLRCYSLRIQQYGQDVSSLSLLTKLTLTSTDPTVTPQVLDMQAMVSSPDIGAGKLITSADYRGTYILDNINDLNTQSDYWTRFDGLYLNFQARNAKPSPFVLADVNFSLIAGQQLGDILLDGLSMDYGADAYRNCQIMKNVTSGSGTTTITRNNTGQFPGTISQAQMAAIENAAGGNSTGIIEAVFDATGMTIAQAIAQADLLLQRYGTIGRTFTPKTLRSGLTPGMQQALFCKRYGLQNAQMLITQIDVVVSIVPGVDGGLLYTWKLTVSEGPNLQSWVKLFINGLGGK